MKKFPIFILILLTTTLSAIADHDAKFFKALSSCSPYTSNGTVDTSGISADYKSQIVGIVGDKCVYKEYINFAGIDSCVTCEFSQDQIDELTKVMEAYKTLQGYSNEEVDITDLESVKNNPIVKVWNKYIQDPSVCTMDINGKLEELMQ